MSDQSSLASLYATAAEAAEQFLETGRRSAADESNELDLEAIRPGGELHSAICALEKHFGRMLQPVPLANAWLRLTAARDLPDPIECQCRCREQAEIMSELLDAERDRLAGVGETSATESSAAECGMAGGGDAGQALPECLVTMQQAAAMVSRGKRTIERWVRMKSCPRPKVLGGGGKPHEYAWSELRPFLEKQSGRKLPPRFPFERFRPV